MKRGRQEVAKVGQGSFLLWRLLGEEKSAAINPQRFKVGVSVVWVLGFPQVIRGIYIRDWFLNRRAF